MASVGFDRASLIVPALPETIDCPVPDCGHSSAHPVAVEVNAGGDITTVDRGGTSVRRGRAVGRGVQVAVRFVGECGHAFDLTLHFHKGSTYVELAPDEAANAVGSHVPKTIWRD